MTDEKVNQVRPIGIAMSDGTVRSFEDVLAAQTELAKRREVTKAQINSWKYRSDRGKARPFPAPLCRLSIGPLWFIEDIDGYVPGNGRWPEKNG